LARFSLKYLSSEWDAVQADALLEGSQEIALGGGGARGE